MINVLTMTHKTKIFKTNDMSKMYSTNKMLSACRFLPRNQLQHLITRYLNLDRTKMRLRKKLNLKLLSELRFRTSSKVLPI
jgi:hypothetical protein